MNRRQILSFMGLAAAFCVAPLRSIAFAVEKIVKSDAEWKQQLNSKQYNILRHEGTEAPFSSPLNAEKRKGIFACAGCGLPLFDASTKFDSGTGWPSFFDALPDALETQTDSTFGMTRVEYHCARCGGHHGHLFDDGPKPTGKRYCSNGAVLTFAPET